MARAFIALGSNLGDRELHLAFALRALAAAPGVRVVGVSSWIETAPVGGPPGQGPYLNGAAELATALDPHALLALLLRIERSAGRVRAEPNGPRTLDLDLLVYDELARNSPDLTLPHPRMEERTFVLEPLCQLAPALRLPSGLSVAERLAELRGSPRRA